MAFSSCRQSGVYKGFSNNFCLNIFPLPCYKPECKVESSSLKKQTRTSKHTTSSGLHIAMSRKLVKSALFAELFV